MKTHEIIEKLNERNDRSAWDRGVTVYAVELVEEFEELGRDCEAVLLNGAASWSKYSYGGCSLIYDEDIAARLCTPSELKRKRGGELPPNGREEWLDVQARALAQAARRVRRIVAQAV